MKTSAEQPKPASSGPIRTQVISNPFPDQSPPGASHNVAAPSDQVAQAAATAPTPAANQTPLSAADNDLIEKTWVDAAEATIRELGDDPFALQVRQAELSRDYLKKRFNLDVGQS